ncbi:MAG: hypothetical protein LC800_02990 [Acidobacteria bacterium]|nr:hypothetical protein [Acidobacteriota bacterium]
MRSLGLILIWAVLRFLMGTVFNQPYAPRGNAAFSVVAVTLISCLIYGAMSGRVGGFGWLGAFLVGVVLGLFAQALIFTATLVSIAAGINSYFVHWDALNIPEGTTATMSAALAARAGGLFFGTLFSGVFALIGRAVFSALAPRCDEPVDRLR